MVIEVLLLDAFEKSVKKVSSFRCELSIFFDASTAAIAAHTCDISTPDDGVLAIHLLVELFHVSTCPLVTPATFTSSS